MNQVDLQYSDIFVTPVEQPCVLFENLYFTIKNVHIFIRVCLFISYDVNIFVISSFCMIK